MTGACVMGVYGGQSRAVACCCCAEKNHPPAVLFSFRTFLRCPSATRLLFDAVHLHQRGATAS